MEPSAAASNPPPRIRPTGPGSLPRVSVLVPAFDGAGVIRATLASVVAQSYPDLELLVIDDGSRDDTGTTVTGFLQDQRPAARLLRHSENWGLSRTLNHALRESSGEVVLILHQDIALLEPDWIERAVSDLSSDPNVAVVTGNYGVPAAGELNFSERVFGVLRRQFYDHVANGIERATFTEFKCDLVRRAWLDRVGGFPERFRIAGEDLWVSYSIREAGGGILKDFSLRSIQRFTGEGTSAGGNLRKEFRFGSVIAGTLLRFRGAVARGLERSAYSRSRSRHRASQPVVVALALALLLLALVTGSWWVWLLLIAALVGRVGYYSARLYPGLRRLLASRGRAVLEALAGAPLGLGSDVAYSVGLLTGLVRWRRGAVV